jgi:hypothetical protein
MWHGKITKIHRIGLRLIGVPYFSKNVPGWTYEGGELRHSLKEVIILD